MITVMELKVGDTAWMVGHAPYYRGREEPVPMVEMRVTKVARKYLTAVEADPGCNWSDGERHFERADGLERGDPRYPQSRTRTLYVDINDYRTKEIRRRAEAAVRRYFSERGIRSHIFSVEVTTEDIFAAAKLLRIELKEKE